MCSRPGNAIHERAMWVLGVMFFVVLMGKLLFLLDDERDTEFTPRQSTFVMMMLGGIAVLVVVLSSVAVMQWLMTHQRRPPTPENPSAINV